MNGDVTVALFCYGEDKKRELKQEEEGEKQNRGYSCRTFGSIQYTPFLFLPFSDNACASIGRPTESATEATAAHDDDPVGHERTVPSAWTTFTTSASTSGSVDGMTPWPRLKT